MSTAFDEVNEQVVKLQFVKQLRKLTIPERLELSRLKALRKELLKQFEQQV